VVVGFALRIAFCLAAPSARAARALLRGVLAGAFFVLFFRVAFFAVMSMLLLIGRLLPRRPSAQALAPRRALASASTVYVLMVFFMAWY